MSVVSQPVLAHPLRRGAIAGHHPLLPTIRSRAATGSKTTRKLPPPARPHLLFLARPPLIPPTPPHRAHDQPILNPIVPKHDRMGGRQVQRVLLVSPKQHVRRRAAVGRDAREPPHDDAAYRQAPGHARSPPGERGCGAEGAVGVTLLEDVPPSRCALPSLVPRTDGPSCSYMFLCVCVLPVIAT